MAGTTYELAPDESVIEGVVTAVADAADRDPTDLPPLSTAINPDALESLYRSERTRRPAGDWQVTFPYEGYEVVVHNYGLIKVRSNEDGEADGIGTREGPNG